ncbi:MAG: anthranilate phosphoribosyltransferase [Bacteroidales bacterium]
MKSVLENLYRQKYLSEEEAHNILVEFARGSYNHSQMASFLTVYRMRNITVGELKGFRNAMLELCISIDLDDFNTIDLCGTGGDAKNTFNISTLASFVTAGAGAQVIKHGNYSVSSSCGSSNVLEYFGYRFSNDQDKLRNELDHTGFCFMHAPMFHPAMKNIAPVRKDLGVQTFFNMLGPLVNPGNPKNQLVGVFSPEVGRLYNYFYQELDKNYTIVHSLDGYDEISLTGATKTDSINGSQLLTPEDFGFERVDPVAIEGGPDVASSAKIFSDILQGKGTGAQNNVVIANTAVALNTLWPEKSLAKCIEMAEDSLYNKKALNVLNRLMEIQQ